jgi:5-methylcytosine-specific restriction endonuclease McrA
MMISDLDIEFSPYKLELTQDGTYGPDEIANLNYKVGFMNEVRELYWTTDIPTKEILAAYLPGKSMATITRIAGSITVNRICVICETKLSVRTRSDFRRCLDEFRDYGECRCEQCIKAGLYTPKQREEFVERERQYREEAQRDQPTIATPPDYRGMPYQEYLQTDQWQERRNDALKRAGFSCQVCCSRAQLHVHHRTYARRGEELDTDLTVLCAECHKIFHTFGKLAEGGCALT